MNMGTFLREILLKFSTSGSGLDAIGVCGHAMGSSLCPNGLGRQRMTQTIASS